MNKKKLILYIIISMFLVACTGKNEKNISLKQKDKAPESLQKLNASLDKILDKTGEIEKIDLDIDFTEEEKQKEQKNKSEEASNPGNEEEQKKSDEKNNKEQNSQQAGEQSNASSQEKENKDKQKEQAKSDKLTKTWQEMDKTLEEVHSLWSAYEAEGMKKGGSGEKGNQFEVSINKMTKAVENRSIVDIYDYGSQSILNLKSFWDLYTDDYRGDIAEVKYGVYQYYLRAISNDKNGALKVINDRDENISRIRVKIEDDDKKIKELDTVAYSLKNLVNSLNEDSKRLYIIKKDTLIENLKSLEED